MKRHTGGSREQQFLQCAGVQNQGGYSLCPNTALCTGTAQQLLQCGNRGFAAFEGISGREEKAFLAETAVRGSPL